MRHFYGEYVIGFDISNSDNDPTAKQPIVVTFQNEEGEPEYGHVSCDGYDWCDEFDAEGLCEYETYNQWLEMNMDEPWLDLLDEPIEKGAFEE